MRRLGFFAKRNFKIISIQLVKTGVTDRIKIWEIKIACKKRRTMQNLLVIQLDHWIEF